MQETSSVPFTLYCSPVSGIQVMEYLIGDLLLNLLGLTLNVK